MPPPRSSITERPFGRAPLFIENVGQWLTPAKLVGRLGPMLVRAEPGAIALQLHELGPRATRGALLRLAFEGASHEARIDGEEPREARMSFFLGDDPSAWMGGAPTFDAVRYRELYSGIDLVAHARHGSLEYDLHLAPGADVAAVLVEVQGAEALVLQDDGTLILRTALGDVRQPSPRCFQILASGEERTVACAYRLLDDERFGFALGPHDESLPVVVDPQLQWSTYLGSATADYVGDHAFAVDFGPGGDVFVTGEAYGTDFPTTPGAFVQSNPLGRNIFVARLRAIDGALLYSCLIGGTGNPPPDQLPTEIAVDGEGRATIVGWTEASDFPTTPGAFQTQLGGGTDAVVFRLSPAGDQLIYSTLLGSPTIGDVANALVLAPSGAAVVGGEPGAGDFPTTPGSYQTAYHSDSYGFITRLDPTASALEWSTFIDATVEELELDADESVVVTGLPTSLSPTPGAWAPPLPQGNNAYIARLNASGSTLLWASLFGGSNSEYVTGLAMDAFGSPVIVGSTDSQDFPTTPGSYLPTAPSPATDVFVVRLDPSGSAPVYSTYIGQGYANDVDVDASGMASVTGNSTLSTMPTTPGAFQTSPPGNINGFAFRIAPGGEKLYYATHLGGPNTEYLYGIVLSPTRRVAVAGASNGGYPTTPNSAYPNYQGGQTDAVVTTFDLLLQGVERLGGSTPACLGPIDLNVTKMPVAGSTRFGFTCSAAPPLSNGWILIGAPAATPFASQGVRLWLDRTQPIARIAVQSDAQGFFEILDPIPSGTGGATFAAQCLMRNTPACGAPASWSASNALVITVQ